MTSNTELVDAAREFARAHIEKKKARQRYLRAMEICASLGYALGYVGTTPKRVWGVSVVVKQSGDGHCFGYTSKHEPFEVYPPAAVEADQARHAWRKASLRRGVALRTLVRLGGATC